MNLPPAQARRRDRKIARRRDARSVRTFAEQVDSLTDDEERRRLAEERLWLRAEMARLSEPPPAGRAVFEDATGEGLDIPLDRVTIVPEVYRCAGLGRAGR